MNRIDQLKPGQAQPEAPAQPAARPQGAPSFQELLDQAHQADPNGRTGGLAPGQGLGGLAGAPATGAINPVAASAAIAKLGPEETEGLLRAERTLDLLESYQKDLADGRKGLKEIFGVVKALEGELGDLMQAMERLAPDSRLHGLLGEIATQAMVESIKFNRGDYNPSPPLASDEAEA